MTERRQNIPDWRVTLGGKDLTATMRPRLVSLSITEKRDTAADELRIVLDDGDGLLAIPPDGAVLSVALGWLQGDDVQPGLIDKGLFKVDQAEWGGPPDLVTLTARSADFAGDLRIRRDGSYRATTLGAIVAKVANRNGLKPAVDPSLAAISVPVHGQSNRSDLAMLRELGRRFDAVATVKAGRLLFKPVGSGTTASGRAIPGATLTPRDGDTYRFTRQARDKYDGVSAGWHDQDAGEKKSVHTGTAGGKRKRMKRTYATEADARAAASAEDRRLKRGVCTLDYSLGLGRPDLYPERHIALAGFKREVDRLKWLVAEVTHALDGEGGLSTSLKLETA